MLIDLNKKIKIGNSHGKLKKNEINER